MNNKNVYQVDPEIDSISEEQLRIVDLIDNICAERKISFKPVYSAKDVMTTDIKTLTLDHTTNAFLRLMKNYNVRHASVVDSLDENKNEPYFVGLISERDVLRLNEPQAQNKRTKKNDRRALRQLLTQIVARKPKSISPQTQVHNIITIMLTNHIDIVPVISNTNLVGIVTTTNLLRLLIRLSNTIYDLYPRLKNKTQSDKSTVSCSHEKALLSSWVSQTVKQILTEQLITLEPNDTLSSAIEIMKQGQFRHIPITDSQQKLIGIVSDRDVLRQLPFAGKRPLVPSKRFREDLFDVDPEASVLDMPLDKIMIKKIKHVLLSCTVHESAKIMRKNRINCLPVVTEANEFRGIITITDMIWTLSAAYEINEPCHA